MCYGYYKDYRRETQKDTKPEPEERPEPKVEVKDFTFWPFPRRHREFTNDPEPVIDRTRERV